MQGDAGGVPRIRSVQLVSATDIRIRSLTSAQWKSVFRLLLFDSTRPPGSNRADQIEAHLAPGALRCHVYHGADRRTDPEYLSAQDIVVRDSYGRPRVHPPRAPWLPRRALTFPYL